MKRLVALLGVVLAACQAPQERAVELLERAQALHGDAEAHTARGDLDGAVRALEEVARLPFPAEAPEGEDVAIDALAEASRVLLAAGRAEDAERAARRALARGTRPSYFAGLAWLRLGDALRALGRAREAVLAFERSIEVNRTVLEGKR